MLGAGDLQTLFVCKSLLCDGLQLVLLELRLLREALVRVLDGCLGLQQLLVALGLADELPIQALAPPSGHLQWLQEISPGAVAKDACVAVLIGLNQEALHVGHHCPDLGNGAWLGHSW